MIGNNILKVNMETKKNWGVIRNIPKEEIKNWNDSYDPYTKEKIRTYRTVCGYCGHSVSFLRNQPLICSWCKHKVYPNKKSEFKDKLMKEIRKSE